MALFTEKILCNVVDRTVVGQGEQSERIRALVAAALKLGLSPAPVNEATTRIAVGFETTVANQLCEKARPLGLVPGRLVGGLLLALERAQPAPPSQLPAQSAGLRPQQVNALNQVVPHLAQGRMVLCEVGTGVGKSILIAHLADHVLNLRDAGFTPVRTDLHDDLWLASERHENSPAARAITKHAAKQALAVSLAGRRCVIVCAPTVANIAHLAHEYEFAVQAHKLTPGRRTAMVLGRSQFVSASALSDYLAEQFDEGIDHPEAAQWLASGMPCGKTAHTAAIGATTAVSALCDDLQALDETIPIERVMLRQHSPEDDQTPYSSLREAAHNAEILFVTHAMLCNDNMQLALRDAPFLPRPLALLVDEAHNLEQAQSAACSQGLSLQSLKQTLNDGNWPKAKLKAASRLVISMASELTRQLQSVPGDLNNLSNIAGEQQQDAWNNCKVGLIALKEAATDLSKMMEQGSDSSPRGLGAQRMAIKETIWVLGKILDGRVASALSFSPRRRQPTLTVGPRTVDPYLAVRWETTPTAVLLSGTLLHQTEVGFNHAATVREFALPPENTVACNPIHPHWLTSTPTVYFPARSGAQCLVPPRVKDSQRLAANNTYAADGFEPEAADADCEILTEWLSHVASHISYIAKTARGGTLVLLSSYERVSILGRLLSELHGSAMEERLIVQSATLSMRQAEALFREKTAKLLRPVWIATGGAGTGLDLSDKSKPAAEDFLLTDVVIPAIPFGTNRTMSHAAKVDFNFAVEVVSALRTFRQYLGRLVRRDGLVGRRLWVLDGRLVQPKSERLMASFLALLQRYDKTVRIEGQVGRGATRF